MLTVSIRGVRRLNVRNWEKAVADGNVEQMFGMNIKQEGIEVLGDQVSSSSCTDRMTLAWSSSIFRKDKRLILNPQDAFARWTHIWRRTLELLHDSFAGPTPEEKQDDLDEDCIVGRYVYVTSPLWGKCKIFYEQSGEGTQDIVFLHTAGSDSRQYHGCVVSIPNRRTNP